jgi:GNAT superfamily N-acetyltransferase
VTEPLPRTRLASLADLDALAALLDAYRQFYEQPADLARARAYLGERMARGECVVYAAIGARGDIVGFTLLYPTFTSVGTARIFVLNDLFVTPAARGTRASVALLEAAKEHARAAGALRLSLRTAHDNLRAQGVYERNGWKRDQRFFTYDFPL